MDNNKDQPTICIKKISELVELKNLTIPFYQRPYKWKPENVIQLLDDIFEQTINKEKVYRIGSLILHFQVDEKDEKSGTFNIVDGQQRLTTISILLYFLDGTISLLLKQDYKHMISKDNIVYNARVIHNWLSKISNKELFKKRLFEKCEFVLFTVYEQDEAFQLFDSQNARGKALEPYDLLKAFHLREMEFDLEEDRQLAVQRWEKSVEDNSLKPILANHLFKIRKWSKNELIYDFTKNEIDEFKGISLHKNQQFPFESALRILDGFTTNAQNDKFLKNHNFAQTYPFSITMPMMNGRRFFEYVDFYIQQKKKLISANENLKFFNFYEIYCLGSKPNEKEERYQGSWRTGDEKVRNLYENILLLFIDKFGFREDFEIIYKAFYKAVYSIRCNSKSIRLENILNSEARMILHEINYSNSPDKLKKYQFKQYDITENDLAKGVEFIKNAINNNFKTDEQ